MRTSWRWRARLLAVLLLPALALAGPVSSAGSAPPPAAAEAVVVQAVPGQEASAAAAVAAAGGRVTLELPIVHGFAATVPAGRAGVVAAHPAVRHVTPDTSVAVQSSTGADTTSTGTDDRYALVARVVRADRLWLEGRLGQGVRVALVDTGVTPRDDLAGRIVPVPDPTGQTGVTVPCVNFSGESTCDDTYGHGTFIAGLIAGDGKASGHRYPGTAPRAELVSVKIAGRDGSADVSKVLAAIQWVVSFRQQLGIEVLNLSLGTDSTVPWQIDPLNYAVEKAWHSGIVVVVSASNRGPTAGTISKPGDDPYVLTVGATDDRRTVDIADDRLPHFSGRGPTAHGLSKPDVVAPGAKVVSLRAPGSLVEHTYPGGGVDATYRRGSGTSMATGTVSGVAALLVQAHPDWTPGQIKQALLQTARPVAGAGPYEVGRGLIDAYAASRVTAPADANAWLNGERSDGSSTLEMSRGTVYVTGPECLPAQKALDPECERVRGQQTARGTWFDNEEYTTSDWTAETWFTSQWLEAGLLGSSWYGSSWYGSSWYGSSWYGSSWYGTYDTTSYGATLAGSSWYGAWE